MAKKFREKVITLPPRGTPERVKAMSEHLRARQAEGVDPDTIIIELGKSIAPEAWPARRKKSAEEHVQELDAAKDSLRRAPLGKVDAEIRRARATLKKVRAESAPVPPVVRRRGR